MIFLFSAKVQKNIFLWFEQVNNVRHCVNMMIQTGIHNNTLEFAALFLNYSFTHRADYLQNICM